MSSRPPSLIVPVVVLVALLSASCGAVAANVTPTATPGQPTLVVPTATAASSPTMPAQSLAPTATSRASTPTPSPLASRPTISTSPTAAAATTSPTTPTAVATPSPVGAASPTVAAGSAIKTVFLVVMENHNWSDIQGNTRRAPYINSLIAGANDGQTSFATQYFNPPGNHPSLPNYLWLVAGQCFDYCGSDRSPSESPNGIDSTQHLATVLDRAGIAWRAYEEGIGGGTCPLKSKKPYVARHNPFVYFNDVSGDPAYCAAHERSFADLAGDLSGNKVARYNFITPDLCHDMHDSCAPANDSIKQGDTWLSEVVPQIQGSAAYKDGGLLLITWDEGEGRDGPIGLIAVSPLAKGHGYASSIRYTHSSTLRTIEEIFGVGPMLGDAAGANDLRDLFARFP